MILKRDSSSRSKPLSRRTTDVRKSNNLWYNNKNNTNKNKNKNKKNNSY